MQQHGFRFGTVNIAGWAGRLDDLLGLLVDGDIDLLFVCETWAMPGSRAPHESVLLHSPWPHYQRVGRNSYGVAVVVHPRWVSRKHEFVCSDGDDIGISARVLFRQTWFCGVYLPPAVPLENCISILEGVLPAPSSANVVLLGDFNMRLGAQVGDARTTARGVHLPLWLHQHGFELNPTPRGIATHVQGPSKWSIVDYIWLSASMLSRVSNALVLSGDDVGGSDHRAVLATVQFLPSPQPALRPRRFLRIQLLQDSAICSAFASRVTLLFASSPLSSSLVAGSQAWLDAMDARICSCLQSAARTVLGEYTLYSRLAAVATPELKDARARRRLAFASFQLDCSPAVKQERWIVYQHARAAQRRASRRAIAHLFDRFSDNMADKSRTEQVKLLARMARVRRRVTGSSLPADAVALATYADFFRSLFDSSSLAPSVVVDDLSVPGVPLAVSFSVEDVSTVLRALPRGKAPGRSGLRGELFSAIPDVLAPWVFDLFSWVRRTGLCPTSWTQASVFPLFKKGRRDDIANYRPISLTEVLRKAFERVVHPELLGLVEPLDVCQGGFRSHRGTVEQVACLHDAVRRRTALLGHAPQLAFLDIKSAYDSVYRPLLWSKLRARGASSCLVKVMMALFDHNVSHVVVHGQESAAVPHVSGLLQGSVLSPLLYALFINDLPQRLRLFGRPGLMDSPIASFLYADDVALVADSSEHMQQLLGECEQHALSHGYRFAATKCVRITTTSDQPVFLHGLPLPTESSFPYLGVAFGLKGIASGAHVASRAQSFQAALSLFRSFGFNGFGFRAQCRSALYTTFLRPVLEYGLSLLQNVGDVKLLQLQQNQALRFMFSAPWSTSSVALHALAGLPLLATRHEVLRARWLRRAFAAPPDCLISHAALESKRRKSGSVLHERARAKVKASGSDEAFNASLRAFIQLSNTALLSEQPGTPTLPLPPSTPFGGGLALLDGFVDRRASLRMSKWLLGRPFGEPKLCLRCGSRRGSKLHLQSCCILNVDYLLSKRRWKEAGFAVQFVGSLCTLWRFSWNPEWRDPARQRASLQALHPP